MQSRGSLSRLCRSLPVVLALAGCASTPLEFVKDNPAANFQGYTTVVIKAFENGVGQELPAGVPLELRASVETRLGRCYPGLLQVAGPKQVDGPEVMIVEGRVTEYREGSRFARFMLAGLGSTKFSSDVVFRDGQSKQELARAKVDLLWAAGGIIGASTGIEDLVKKAAAQVADAIAEKKGARKAEDCS